MSALTYYAGQMPDPEFAPHQTQVFDQTKLVMVDKLSKIIRLSKSPKSNPKIKNPAR